jgi:Ni/Fe-hydrogenase subunit HybB-like protein
MWLERFLIVVPPLEHKYLPYNWGGSYRPTWVEITIMVGTAAGMVLLYVLFAKFVPMISMWELRAGEHATAAEVEARGVVGSSGAVPDAALLGTNG